MTSDKHSEAKTADEVSPMLRLNRLYKGLSRIWGQKDDDMVELASIIKALEAQPDILELLQKKVLVRLNESKKHEGSRNGLLGLSAIGESITLEWVLSEISKAKETESQ